MGPTCGDQDKFNEMSREPGISEPEGSLHHGLQLRLRETAPADDARGTGGWFVAPFWTPVSSCVSRGIPQKIHNF